MAGKDRLRACKVNIGHGDSLSIATNATNVRIGTKCVVATVGTEIEVNGEIEKVTKVNVGGVISEGMLCDSRMLQWSGGASGIAVHLPDSFSVGSPAPASRPRLDGQSAQSVAPEISDKERKAQEKLFRKQYLAEKKASRKAAKAKDGVSDGNECDEDNTEDGDNAEDVRGK